MKLTINSKVTVLHFSGKTFEATITGFGTHKGRECIDLSIAQPEFPGYSCLRFCYASQIVEPQLLTA